MGRGWFVLGDRKSTNRLPDDQMTCNDTELNETIVRAVPELREVSDLVRAGRLDSAVVAHAKLEDTVRKMGWRLLQLRYKRKD